jgi:serine phosphatase RsbU (regulator of sigma subunit)
MAVDSDDRTIAYAPSDASSGRASGRLCLSVLQGSNVGEMIIGRGNDAAIKLLGEGISRAHCKVLLVPGGATLQDLGSTNGTFCNGEVISGVITLKEGDKIQVGNTTVLRFTTHEMVEQIQRAQSELLRFSEERKAMAREVEVARTLQQGLIPAPEPVEREKFRFMGLCQPATICGGDWWTYRDLGDGRTLILIGDVTGHGLDSAMITATAKASIDVAFFIVKSSELTASKVLEIMNRAIYDSTRGSLLMTCFACVIDPRNRTVTYSNASHEFPYILRQVPEPKVMSMVAAGDPLGLKADARFKEFTVPLQRKDTLVLYTDGVIDLQNDRGKKFGDKGLRKAMEKQGPKPPEELLPGVLNATMQFAAGSEQGDDIALVVGQFDA